MKKWTLAIVGLAVVCLVLGGSVLAYNSLEGRNKTADNNKSANHNEKLTVAEGIPMLVKAFDLNIDNLRFIKEPLTSDYYKRVSDDAPYAKDFIIAQFTLDLPSDIDPQAIMTKEQFAQYLFTAMTTKGEFAFIELYVMITDEDQVNPDYMNAIQKLLISKVMELDKDGNFHPKAEMTRDEAQEMIDKTLKVVQDLTGSR